MADKIGVAIDGHEVLPLPCSGLVVTHWHRDESGWWLHTPEGEKSRGLGLWGRLTAPRARPFSYMSMRWTDTGQRPWWWCWLCGAMFLYLGLNNLYSDGEVMMTVIFILLAGVNVGMLGMRNVEKGNGE